MTSNLDRLRQMLPQDVLEERGVIQSRWVKLSQTTSISRALYDELSANPARTLLDASECTDGRI